jgi:hypothetical protein
MSTLHVYSNRHIKGQVVNIKKGDWIYLENSLSAKRWSLYFNYNKINEKKLKLTYITHDEFFALNTENGMNKKFDVIVGNPPYQAPTDVENSKKLYIDISKKSTMLLKKGGTILFITPQAILVSSKLNTMPDLFNGKLSSVDFTANDHFNVGQSLISWVYNDNFVKNRKIKIIDKTVRYVNDINLVSSDENKILIQIINKVDFTKNGFKKLEILQAQDKKYIPKEHLKNDFEDGFIEVVCSGTQRIKYCAPEHSYKPGKQLVIPFVGDWNVGTEITDKPVNKELFLNKNELSNNELLSLKSYLDSKLIKFCVTNYKKIKPSMGYVFLRKLSHIGFDKIWSDIEIYNHFNITKEEIEYIESNI